MKKFACISCILVIFLAGVFELNSAEILYQKKPAWWDDVNIKITPGGSYYDTYNKTFSNLDYGGTKIENWSVLGPFDNNNNKPFAKEYGPEKTLKFDKKEVFKGLKGEKLQWSPWRKGSKCPIAEKISNCVIFLYSVYDAPTAGKHFLLYSSNDGSELWINRKKVYQLHGRSELNLIEPKVIEVDLKKGKNEILLKLENLDAGWGVNLIITTQNPIEIRIKTLSELYSRSKDLYAKGQSNFYEEIETLYLAHNDFPNYIFWFNNEITNLNESKKLSKKLSTLKDLIKNKKEILPYITRYLQDILSNPKQEKSKRICCAEFIIEYSLDSNDFKTLENFLTIYKSQLKSLMPTEFLVAQINLQIKKGDIDEAGRLYEELEGQSKGRASKRYGSLAKKIISIKSSALQLPVDWDFSTIQAESAKFEQNKTPKVNRFIRQTLTNKANLVSATKNKKLFAGTLKIYKKLFEPFAQEYSPDLKAYLATLNNAGAFDETGILQREALLSLGDFKFPTEKQQVIPSDIASIELPGENTKPFEFLNMHQGTYEMQSEINFIADKLEKQPPAFICSNGNIQIFQNYHEVVCLENNRLKWQYILPNSTLLTITEKFNERQTRLLFGKTNPIIDQGKFFARLFQDGMLRLFCFDAENGNMNWFMSDEKLETCSGIALWRDRLILIAREPDLVSRYFLLEINKEDGVIIRKTFLYASDISFRCFASSGNRIQADLFMPAPQIVDNQAFISTNSGVIASFDLSSNSINWIMEYNQTPLAESRDATNAISGRQTYSPIVNSSRALFYPLNSNAILLLDKFTGEQISSLILNWKEIIPCGNEQVIIIDNTRKAAFYSLDDFKKLAELPGTGYRFVQQLWDGVILQNNNKLLIYDFSGKLKKSMIMPKDTLAVFADQNSLFAYNNKNNSPAVIEKFLAQKPATVINSATDNILPEMKIVSFKTFADDKYLIANNSVVKLNPDASQAWVRSLPNSSTIKLYQQGNYIYVFTGERMFCINKNNGKTENFFPAYSAPLYPLISEIICPDGAFFFTDKTRDFDLYRLNPEKTEKLSNQRTETPIAAFYNSDLLAVWKKNSYDEVKFLSKNPKTNSFKETSCELKNPFKPFIRRVIHENAVLYSNLDNFLLVNADKTVNELNVTQGNNKRVTRFGQKSKLNVVLYDHFCLFRVYLDLVNIIDLKTKKDLGTIPNFTEIPLYIDNKLIGIAGNDIVCFDPIAKKIIYKTPFSAVKKRAGKKTTPTTFKLNNKAAFFFANTTNLNKRRSAENLVLLFSADKAEPETIRIPGLDPESVFLDTGEALLIFMPDEKQIIRLSKQEFNDIQKQSPNLFTIKNTPVEYQIDGFADEWDLSTFHKLNKNKLDARIIDEKFLLLALEINDKDIIQQMGKSGFDDRYKILISPGSIAAFSIGGLIEKGSTAALYIPLKSSKEKNIVAAYSVKPDGTSCFIEVQIPLTSLNSIQTMIKIPDRERRGDFAFELLFTNLIGQKYNLFSSREIPAFFPRFFFPDFKDNKKRKR